MNPILIKFLVRLIVFTAFVFVIHLYILNTLEFPLFNNEIVFSYVINVASAIIIFLMLFLLRNKFKNQLGFIFLFGSVIKFGLFILFLYKPFYADGLISKAEFLRSLFRTFLRTQ